MHPCWIKQITYFSYAAYLYNKGSFPLSISNQSILFYFFAKKYRFMIINIFKILFYL